ncbi:MAG: hypothetical protein M8364_11985 [Methylobacter sp.]|uniref:hypothetical protein n=1 Tax=Methylobacter sp. TaxID=2051955 RepID=UPI00258A34A4|nr:hypothetical protein [Methylobacter sp.]MCL7421612.1 hypothetical protein [Methylobacter sp.]
MTAKKKGRPPKGNKPMTPAEKQKAYRTRQKAAEIKQAYFTLTGSLVDELDSIANHFELTRTQVINDLLISVLSWALPEFTKTAAEIDEQIKQYPIQPSAEAIQQFKAEYWRLLIDSVKKQGE